jgi:hypothetical protein
MHQSLDVVELEESEQQQQQQQHHDDDDDDDDKVKEKDNNMAIYLIGLAIPLHNQWPTSSEKIKYMSPNKKSHICGIEMLFCYH